MWLTKYTAPKLGDTTISLINQTVIQNPMSLTQEDVNRSSDFSSIHTFFEAKKHPSPFVPYHQKVEAAKLDISEEFKSRCRD